MKRLDSVIVIVLAYTGGEEAWLQKASEEHPSKRPSLHLIFDLSTLQPLHLTFTSTPLLIQQCSSVSLRRGSCVIFPALAGACKSTLAVASLIESPASSSGELRIHSLSYYCDIHNSTPCPFSIAARGVVVPLLPLSCAFKLRHLSRDLIAGASSTA